MSDVPEKKALEWYYKGWSIVVAILFLGPLGLILLWGRPETRLWIKMTVSVVVLAITIWMFKITADTYRLLLTYYKELAEVLK